MALKEYIINGLRYQFDEKDAPNGAVPVEDKQPVAKRRATTANKARKAAANKAAQ